MAQAAQLPYVGVPVHVGPSLKMCGEGASWIWVVAQQIRSVVSVQSLSPLAVLHDFGHVAWHKPSAQQRPPVVAQSLDCVHFVGHGSASGAFGARQSPVTLELRAGSTLRTEVQHT